MSVVILEIKIKDSPFREFLLGFLLISEIPFRQELRRNFDDVFGSYDDSESQIIEILSGEECSSEVICKVENVCRLYSMAA